MYCSADCYSRTISARVSTLPASANCSLCGSEFKPVSTGGKPSSFCSSSCKAQAKLKLRATSRRKQKARKRAVTVESVDAISVFDRDSWKCQICGVKTPKSLRGTYDDRAPELDHIHPISKGGEHSYRNTQCTCRKCNAEKSDGAGGQLRLF
ncbi:HNH endonuclease [Thioclava sp. NG1]|uniref:HNH endonuclease n=1 Tax=Thioclava sp. NG1 TaxID=2182426 RepID=UPI003513D6A7